RLAAGAVQRNPAQKATHHGGLVGEFVVIQRVPILGQGGGRGGSCDHGAALRPFREGTGGGSTRSRLRTRTPLDHPAEQRSRIQAHMRIVLATDAWEPQVNGVVRTLTRTIAECRAMGHEVEVVEPSQFKTIPCPTYPEIRLALGAEEEIRERLRAFA